MTVALCALAASARADQAVTIRFVGETAPRWDVVPGGPSVDASRGRVFGREITIRNKSSDDVLAMIVAEIRPADAAGSLVHLGCGPAFSVLLQPGEAAAVPTSYVVADTTPRAVTALEVHYTVASFEAIASPRLRAGTEIYAARCATCHGASGRGDGPIAALLGPALTDLRPALETKSDGELLEAVRAGVGAMPAFAAALDPAEIEALLVYLRSLRSPGATGVAR